MNKIAKAALVAVAVLSTASSAFAAPRRAAHHPTNDPWFEELHLNPSAPAKQYFEQMNRDGE